MKKMLSTLLVISMLVIGAPSFATERADLGFEASELGEGIVVQRADEFFNSYNVTVSKQGGGKINITFSVTAYEQSSVLGVSSYDVQQKINGSWTTVSSYITGSVGYDRSSYTFEHLYSGTAGSEYRVFARFYCMKYNNSTRTNGVYSGSVVAN